MKRACAPACRMQLADAIKLKGEVKTISPSPMPCANSARCSAEVPDETFERMREFAGEVSSASTDDLIAVVHLGVYALDDGDASLLSSGAVWLDEQVANREEGIARLLDLVVTNIDGIRPAIRQHLGLPPLP